MGANQTMRCSMAVVALGVAGVGSAFDDSSHFTGAMGIPRNEGDRTATMELPGSGLHRSQGEAGRHARRDGGRKRVPSESGRGGEPLQI